MVSAHPHTIDTTRQPPKLGDFFSPYQQQQQQQQPSLISNNYDNNNSNNGYENINFIPQGHHRPQSVTNLPLRQQNQNNALARQSQQQNRRSPLLNAPNNNLQFVNPLGRPPPLMSSPDGFLNQENPQLLQNRSNSQNSIPKNPKLYKTELCRSYMDHGRCNYGERCQYAHGTDEKRQIPRHPKYKTEACSSYHKTGYCPYGPRCHFIHNEDPALLRQLIAQNAAAMGTVGSEQSSPSLTPTTQRPRNLNLHQTMSAPPSTVATPQQQQPGHPGQHQQCQRQYSTILPIGSRPSLPQTPQQQQYFVQKQLGSDGESPIPSSTDSGSESPLGSFSPGLEESLCRLSPTSFRRSLSTTTTRWSPTSGLPTNFPTTTNSSAAVAGVNVGGGIIFNSPNDPWNDSSLINSLSSLSFSNEHHSLQQLTPTTPIDNPWETTSSQATTTKTCSPAPARLPVFERLSNNL